MDAVAESTFISEYYLRFRGLDQRAVVVPLDDLDDVLDTSGIDLAINVHSFSECTLESIKWWLDVLQKHKIKHLMLVPNAGSHGGTELLSTEHGAGKKPAKDMHKYFLDLLPHIEARGYQLVVKEPKYLDPVVQKHGVSPTYHYLFRLAA